MRVLVTICFIFFLVFQAAGGLAASCTPCAAAMMDPYSCPGGKTGHDGRGLVARCCCALQADAESREHETPVLVEPPRTGFVWATVPAFAKGPDIRLSYWPSLYLSVRDPGSPPALYQLKNSYLI